MILLNPSSSQSPIAHDWIEPVDLRAAAQAQREMAERTETIDRLGWVRIVAGADSSMGWRDSMGPVSAAIAPLSLDDYAATPAADATVIPRFPYVPGYLGFREVPALLAAWDALQAKPDLLFVDGHGRAHPRRCGIATHIGVVLDLPTIGVAKSILCGTLDRPLGEAAGSRAMLVDSGEPVAVAVRTRRRANPIYISNGHRLSLDSAVEWTLKLCDGRRAPLPIRLAHDAANAARRAVLADAIRV